MVRNRRKVLSIFCLGLGLTWPAYASAKSRLTPSQMKGPFYPDQIPLDSDNDLLQVAGLRGTASGHYTNLIGRVFGIDGQPIGNAKIEIWQCDAFGNYKHRRDGGGQDPFFQGFGRTFSDLNGRYRFKTIKPVAYPGRAPHIHMRITKDRIELITQIYVQGEFLNDRDFLLNTIKNESIRNSLIVPFKRENGVFKDQFLAIFNPVIPV